MYVHVVIYRELAQHKLVFKSKMGKNVEGDMVRFQVSNTDECYASNMHAYLRICLHVLRYNYDTLQL